MAEQLGDLCLDCPAAREQYRMVMEVGVIVFAFATDCPLLLCQGLVDNLL